MKKRVATHLALVAICLGCGEGKGLEEAEPVDGKLDSFHQPTDMGALPWAEPKVAEISGDARFHAWGFELTRTAAISIETRQVDAAKVDTVIYLYRQGEDGDWGRYLHRDDDGGKGAYSQLDTDELVAGRYRILVKAHQLEDDGTYEIELSCAGCEGADPAVCDALDDWSWEACAEAENTSDAGYWPDCLAGHPDGDQGAAAAACCATRSTNYVFCPGLGIDLGVTATELAVPTELSGMFGYMQLYDVTGTPDAAAIRAALAHAQALFLGECSALPQGLEAEWVTLSTDQMFANIDVAIAEEFESHPSASQAAKWRTFLAGGSWTVFNGGLHGEACGGSGEGEWYLVWNTDDQKVAFFELVAWSE